MKWIICLLAGLILLTAGCAKSPQDNTPTTPTKDSTASAQPKILDPRGNVILYVSNQSSEIDPVDITIKVNGQQVIDDDFEWGTGHNPKQFILRLSSGRHVLTALSTKGGANLKKDFSVAGKRWILVEYWYSTTAHPPMPKELNFRIHDEPLGFD